MKFRILQGSYFVAGTMHNRGDVVESNEDLTEKFLNKFERIYEEAAPAQPIPEAAPSKSKAISMRELTKVGLMAERKADGTYAVYDCDNPDDGALNDTELPTKAAIKIWLKEFLAD